MGLGLPLPRVASTPPLLLGLLQLYCLKLLQRLQQAVALALLVN